MKSLKVFLFLLTVAAMVLTACGEGYRKESIVIKGSVDATAIGDDRRGPVMLAILRVDASDSSKVFTDLDIETILEHPGDSVVEYFSIDAENPNYDVDVTDSGLRPGDNVVVFAFVANNYSNGVIAPKFGDFVGIGMGAAMDRMPLVHEIKTGVNAIDVKIDREYVDIESRISGELYNFDFSAPMDIYVVAYMAEDKMTAISFSDNGLGFDGIVGYYQKKNFTPDPQNALAYTLDIIPYLPYLTYDQLTRIIDNISIFVWLDVNRNGQVDDQDYAGYYVNPEDNFSLKSNGETDLQIPASLNIQNRKDLSGIDIYNFVSLAGLTSEADPVQASSALETITLKGSVTLPGIAGSDVGAYSYIIIADADYLNTMKTKPLDGLYYFNRIPEGRKDFEFEIADSHLQPGAEVMIIGLWDRDNQGWYPAPTSGDYLGLYLDMENLSTTYKIKAGANSGIDIKLSREVFDFDKTISGKMNIDINAYPNATATIIAYAGELNSMDMTQLNPDAVIGMDVIKSGRQSSNDYQMPIFPFGCNLPVDDVCIYAMLDENSDGQPEKIGYHANPKGTPEDPRGLWPAILRLEADQEDSSRDISFFQASLPVAKAPPQPQAMPAEITCTFDLPVNAEPEPEASPIFAAVFKISQTDIADLFTPDSMLKKISYLQKITPGENTFTIGADAGIYRGDEILITVFRDLDYNSCYPRPTVGDRVGYYNDMNNFGMLTVKLEDQGEQKDGVAAYRFSPGTSQRFEFSRTYYDHQAALKFNINEVDGYILPEDPIIVFAIQGDLLDMINMDTGSDFSINWQSVDLDHIVAYNRSKIVSGDADAQQYELKLLPFLSPDIVRTSPDTGNLNLIEKVFLFVVDEAYGTANGIPESGELIGYYHDCFKQPNQCALQFTPWRRVPQPIDISDKTLELPGAVFMPGREPIELP